MKTKKWSKSIVIILILYVVFAFSGCGGDSNNNKESNSIESEVNNTMAEDSNIVDAEKDTDNEYKEITSELPEGSSLFVTNIIDNGDTYQK